MAHAVGRNDPCPCGSGKKFKRCCGATPEAAALLSSPPQGEPVSGWARAHALWPKTRETLLPYAIEWLGETRVEESFAEFEGPDVRKEANADFLELFLTWQLYDWIPEDETRTVAAEWLAESSIDLPRDPDVERLVRSASANPLTFFQVQAVDPGRGVVLRDLLTHEERFVVDRSLSESLPPWTIIVARLIEFSDITFFDAIGPRALPPEFAEDVVGWLEENLERKLPLKRDELRDYALDILECYQAAIAADDKRRSQRPVLHNTDGDLLVMCKDAWSFERGARQDVLQRLVKLGLDADDPHVVPTKLAWMKEEKDGSQGVSLGTVTVAADTLTLETNSRERQKRMRAKIARALARLARHEGSEEQTQDELFSKQRGDAEESDPDDVTEKIPPEMAAQVLREYLTKHYSTWPDDALPALKGKTPRQAVKTTKGRAEVEALLREMEHRSHGSPMADAYDFDNLRRELGLEPARGPLG